MAVWPLFGMTRLRKGREGVYLHLGQSVVVPYEAVLGIFDLDNASWSHRTRSFLERAEKEGRVINAAAGLPRSFVLCGREGVSTVYLSPLSPAVLRGRAAGNGME